jgi:hypothetical protein
VVARFASRCVERPGPRVERRPLDRVIGGGRRSHFTNAAHILYTATRRPGVGHGYLIGNQMIDRRHREHGPLQSCDQADYVDPARRTGRGPSAAGARQRGAVQHLAEDHQRVEDLQDAALVQLPNGEAAGADPDDGDFASPPPARRKILSDAHLYAGDRSRPGLRHASCRDTRRILSVVRGYSPPDMTAQGCPLEPCPRGTGRQARDSR